VCLIIDANLAFCIFTSAPEDDFLPVIDWLYAREKYGCVVYGGRLAGELSNRGKSYSSLLELLRAGRARLIPDKIVHSEEEKLMRAGICKSNDPHVIALARVSGARTLCSHDQKLHQDFRNPILISKPRGRVYQNATHANLLCHDPSCHMGDGRRKKCRS
jgi:hypothetical protein